MNQVKVGEPGELHEACPFLLGKFVMLGLAGDLHIPCPKSSMWFISMFSESWSGVKMGMSKAMELPTIFFGSTWECGGLSSEPSLMDRKDSGYVKWSPLLYWPQGNHRSQQQGQPRQDMLRGVINPNTMLVYSTSWSPKTSIGIGELKGGAAPIPILNTYWKMIQLYPQAFRPFRKNCATACQPLAPMVSTCPVVSTAHSLPPTCHHPPSVVFTPPGNISDITNATVACHPHPLHLKFRVKYIKVKLITCIQ